MTFEVPDKSGLAIDCMQRLEHVGIPAGNYCIIIINVVKQERDNTMVNTRHITGRDKDQVAVCGKRSGMKSPDRSDSCPDISYTSYISDAAEPPALFRVPCNEDNL